ncbi:MAG: hypothetical protein NZZ41_06265 [Candidatus Dojkabacteria bacterium]|nr:hypothetical protein [Candidatus Dojkabacteria bacterium]
MAATPKHRRSSSKARSTKASNRYDKTLWKFKVMQKKGGTFLVTRNGKTMPINVRTLN